MSSETALRERIVEIGLSLVRRGFAHGTSGNISARLSDGILLTPTNSSLGNLSAESLSKVSLSGAHVSGDPPSKEAPLHLAVYRSREGDNAVVHLHSTHAVAVSCLAGLDPDNVFPPITPYSRMRLGTVKLVPYHRPGDPAVADAIARAAPRHHVLLLANHGSVVAAPSLDDGLYVSDELEETARLYLMLRHEKRNDLSPAAVEELDRHFPRK
ncbi:MAG TPA: 3-oxo-tetronate 4-phosphate decarboxylase [Thermoanaerobaculia bacterium]|nr:3-oxo-tetronate 4-phosphate decarboxylase [Thermoanaerobaculia bacterium]